MTTENDTPPSTVQSVPPVPPPPGSGLGTVQVPADGVDAPEGIEEPDGDGVRAGAVKAARAALAVARDAAKRVQTVATGAHDPVDDLTPVPAPAGGAADGKKGRSAAPQPQMHYATGGVRLTPDGRPAPEPGAPGGPGAGQSPSVHSAQPAGVGGPRRVRLTVSRIDPWSVMKLAFLLAVAIGIMTVVASAVFWYVIDGLGIFGTIQTFISDVVGQQANVDITQFVAFDRLVSLATLIAVVNVVLLTAITTIMALLYNITAALVGGVHVTLTDD
ncbi:DUF3566 domain-containing protein [Xylanimonas sp. McL0601]|uniref:DUF3566 domain-containing protein n=1 Tax=Xylanimonas sp. McL0601 TaxID=3414739 RepID=UPI003CE80C89